MEQIGNNILHYILLVFISTGNQLFILFGPLLLLSFIMNYVALLNEQLSYSVWGRTLYLYVFGWLGTSVHELGHALFAILFGHKINEIVFFSPNNETGSLGSVNHSFNKKSIYQNIGNFFIGIGPILLGSVCLFFITYLLYHVNIIDDTISLNIETFYHFSTIKKVGIQLGNDIFRNIKVILFESKDHLWKLVVLLFCVYSIGSSVTLSPSDINAALKGFLYFVIVLLLFNLITLWIGSFTQIALIKISSFLSGLYFLIILSILVNCAFIIFLFILKTIKTIFQ